MDKVYQIIFDAIEANKGKLLQVERDLWKIPEAGFREWKTHAYLKKEYEALGYRVHEAGNIPGFYVDIDTGRPGPRFAILGEMDALVIPEHPDADPENGCVHSCAHHCQSTALLGVAIGLAEPGVLDELCGSIRLLAVPAEELIEMEYRKSLMDQGILHFYGGKQEFIYRGFLNDCDMAMMVHTGDTKVAKIVTNMGSNGCIAKKYTFIGKSAHASSPSVGLNALYAATNAINGANALREVFGEDKWLRFHPIITKGGDAVNVIPREVKVESFVRGSTMESIIDANEKINRSFAAGAAAAGCRLIIDDKLGYAPRHEDENLRNVVNEVAHLLVADDEIKMCRPWVAGCTDMGDVSLIMPVIHPHAAGSSIPGHTSYYQVEDAYNACVTSAKLQAGTALTLLKNGAAIALKVIAEKKVVYDSVEAYLEAAEKLNFHGDAVIYNEDDSVTLRYKK